MYYSKDIKEECISFQVLFCGPYAYGFPTEQSSL